MRLDDLLREVAEARGSDLYLAAGAVPCMNCEGVYRPLVGAQGKRLTTDQAAEFARQALTERQWKDFEDKLEANLAYMSQHTGRFRVNLFWQRGSIAMVCRRVIMDIPTMRSLGLPPVLRGVALSDRGIVLVTGSTGSGKSTTLASMIDYRNHLRSGHIVTIEDPVEFVYRHRRSIVTQREVGIDTLSFHEALKNTLRQAPQVICIGEMRDAETVQFAMHAAETGHLVFATLHSTNAVLALERILHFYPGEMKEQILMQLSLNLSAVICQRLVQKIGGGRVAAHEIMLNTPRFQDLIGKGEMGNIRQSLGQENQDGFTHFDRSLYRLHKMGKVTMEDALKAAESANDLQLKFRGIGVTQGSSWTDFSDPWAGVTGDYDPPTHLPGGTVMRDPSATGHYSNESAPPLPSSSNSARMQVPINVGTPQPGHQRQARPPAAPPPAGQPMRPRQEGQQQAPPPHRPPPPQRPPQQGQQPIPGPGQRPAEPNRHKIFHTPVPPDSKE